MALGETAGPGVSNLLDFSAIADLFEMEDGKGDLRSGTIGMARRGGDNALRFYANRDDTSPTRGIGQ